MQHRQYGCLHKSYCCRTNEHALFPGRRLFWKFKHRARLPAGDGRKTRLYCDANPSNSNYYPQLIKITNHTGTLLRISDMQIYGTSYEDANTEELIGNTYDGVVFDPDDRDTGGVVFQNVSFEFLARGVAKPSGEIGNTFINCGFYQNLIGYYAQNNPSGGIHCGADEFIRGSFQSCLKAAMYIEADASAGYGQLNLEGTIIEGNPGFGILIVFSGGAKLTGNAISLNNVWLEQNGTPAISGAMDGSQMVPAVSSGGTGTIKGTFNPLSNILTLTVDYTGLSSAATSAQLYNGASGTIGTFIGSLPAFPPSSSPWNGEFQLTNAADINAALNNNLYLTISAVSHPFPSAEIRSQLITNNIIIAGKTFTPSELRWIRLEGVRSVSINASYVNSVELIDSSMSLFNCRSDRSYGTNIVNVDDSSSLVASEHRYGPPVSENIFVNSISYDGSTDIYNDPQFLTSVWGPLRTTLMAGLTNVVLSQPMFKGIDVELWNGYDGRPDADAFAVQDAGTTANYVGPSYAPELNIMCREMGLTDQDLVYSTESFTPVAGLYYF